VSGQQFEALCGRLSDYLSLRSFFVGYGVTAADVAIWGQLQGELAGQVVFAAVVHVSVYMMIYALRRNSSRRGHLGAAAG
jgi:membrane protein implicated in regulation of membrane protease activity